MAEKERIRRLSPEDLESVSGGTTKVYRAAVDLMNGVYGTGADAQKAIGDLGLDYWEIQHMANALMQGYGQVAQDVIDNKYGKDAARFKALSNAGYDPILVQSIVNGMLRND